MITYPSSGLKSIQVSKRGLLTILFWHCGDVIIGAIASQITSLTIVYSTVYTDKKHQSSASLAFVRGNHRGPVNSPHKWPVTRKMFPFDDVIMKPLRLHLTSQIAKSVGPTWGSSGSCRPQMGSTLAPWTLLSGMVHIGARPQAGTTKSDIFVIYNRYPLFRIFFC